MTQESTPNPGESHEMLVLSEQQIREECIRRTKLWHEALAAADPAMFVGCTTTTRDMVLAFAALHFMIGRFIKVADSIKSTAAVKDAVGELDELAQFVGGKGYDFQGVSALTMTGPEKG